MPDPDVESNQFSNSWLSILGKYIQSPQARIRETLCAVDTTFSTITKMAEQSTTGCQLLITGETIDVGAIVP